MRWPLILGVAAAGVCAVVVLQGARAAWIEYRGSSPPRGHVSPPDAGELPSAWQDVVFHTRSKAAIRGWWVTGSNGAAVILVHGTGGNRRSLLPEAKLLAEHHYSVLVYDHPGHGESEGRPLWTRDVPEALDAAIDWVRARPGVEPNRVGALGFSMGASTVADVASRDRRVSAVVLEGCFTDAVTQTRNEYAKWGPIQQIPALLVMRAFGIGAGDLRPVDQVARLSPRPVLLIAGRNDETVPPSMVRELFDAAREPKELWIVEGAAHGDYAEHAPDEYAKRLVGFFDGGLRSGALHDALEPLK
jgi:uncharacterized protein